MQLKGSLRGSSTVRRWVWRVYFYQQAPSVTDTVGAGHCWPDWPSSLSP
jgi:hypothetical protein